MTDAQRLAEALDGAKMVRYDHNQEIVLAWFGGHGLHAYNLEGEEIHFSNVGDFAKSDATPGEIADEIRRMISEGDYD